MEILTRMISVTVDRKLLSGFSNDELLVSHLLFANVTLIFCEANCEQLFVMYLMFRNGFGIED
jgi:hypothetical protein